MVYILISFLRIKVWELGMVMCTYNPSTQATEAEEFWGVKNRPGMPGTTLSQQSQHIPLSASSWPVPSTGHLFLWTVLAAQAMIYWIPYHIKHKASYSHFDVIEKRIHMNIIFYFRNSITETFSLENMMSLWLVLNRLSQVCSILHVLSLKVEAACDNYAYRIASATWEAEAEDHLSSKAQG